MTKEEKSKTLNNNIVEALKRVNEPLSRGELIAMLIDPPSPKTVQRYLVQLCKLGLIDTSGSHNLKKYFIAHHAVAEKKGIFDSKADIKAVIKTENTLFSDASLKKLKFLDTPSFARKKQTYNALLVENYIPNKTNYINVESKRAMFEAGLRFDKDLAAGTYAKEIVQRLLIDLSYNSSRLEGNTYSLLETQNLLEDGVMLDGTLNEEAIMILNHKEAILFLVENATELEVTPFVIRNLHQLLSQDLLSNLNACGKVRNIAVGISKSAYLPLNNAQQLEERLMLLLRKAQKIVDPFEQSFFLLIHLSYLQAFEDVNKRTARLTCNIPFIQMNLCPLSFVDVQKDDYIASLLYFYETGDFEPAAELFKYAYLKSCEKYIVVKKSIGQIDAYRIKFRKERKEVLGNIIREMLMGADIELTLEAYCSTHNIGNADKFISIALTELNNIHSGAVIGLGVTEAMLNAWIKAKDATL